MTAETTPLHAQATWLEDAAALILTPKRAWKPDRPLARLISQVMLSPGESVSTELRDKIVVAALAEGERRASIAGARAECAEREGVRGYLWLPADIEADFEHGGLPANEDDLSVVADGPDFNRDEVMQRQRWAALRMGRALGKEYKRSTLRKYGLANRARFAARLSEDLEAFFRDDRAVEQFVVDVVDRDVQQQRFRVGSYVSLSLQQRLRMAAEPLGRVPPYYPSHLTTSALAEDRELAPYSPDEHAALVDPYYYDSPSRRSRFAESAWKVLERERRLVILGDPGSGKSTIARAAVLRALAVSERAVAVFIPAPVLARELPSKRASWLHTLAEIALSTPLDQATEEEIHELAGLLQSSASALVVVDGIDEVNHPEQRGLLDGAVEALSALRLRAVVTSRVVGYEALPGWTTTRAQPLQDFDGLLHRWYGDENSPAEARGRAAYASSKTMAELVQSPVMAGLVAARAADPNADFSDDLSRLYSWALTALCERDWKRPQHPKRSDREVVALLAGYEDAAWSLSGGDQLEGESWWQSFATYRQLHDAGVDADLVLGGDLLVAYGVPNTSARIDAPWLWLHRSFAGYLVGRRLARMWEAQDPRLTEVLQGAFQYRHAWTDPLRFFVSSLTPLERQAVWDAIARFAQTGDPGSIISIMAYDVFEGLLPNVGDFVDTYTRDDLVSRPALIPHQLDTVVDTEEDQVEILRAYVAAAPERLSGRDRESIRFSVPRPYAIVLAERLRKADGAPPRVESVWGDEIEGDDPILEPLWEGFLSDYFPINLPYGLALSDYLLDFYELDEESKLVFWATGRIVQDAYPIPKRLRAGKKILRRALAGEWGDWGAFTVAHLEPSLVSSDLETLSPHARVGFLLSSFGVHWLEEEPSPAKTLPITFNAQEAMAAINEYADTDSLDIDAVERLVHGLRALGHTTDPHAIDALIRLRHRLGHEPGWEWGERFATSADDLRSFVRASIASTMAGLDRDAVVRRALALRAAGEVWRWWALLDPDIAMPSDDELRVEVLCWVAEQDLIRLDAYQRSMISISYEEAVGVLERVPSALRGAPEFLRGAANTLSAVGALPLWRERLMAIENASAGRALGADPAVELGHEKSPSTTGRRDDAGSLHGAGLV